ncbi:MAG: alpha/beta fold hydrolase [Sulfitobacter sp.]
MIWRIITGAVLAVVLAFGGALGLVFTQNPKDMSGQSAVDFSLWANDSGEDAAPLQPLRMADGYDLMVRTYGGADNVPLLVILHGAGWHGLGLDKLANGLSGHADVIVPDLRGHGTSPGERGTLSYIGEFEDDLARMIYMLKKPDQKIIMAGHGAGGGLVMRFAGGPFGGLLDGAVLLAPSLGPKAVTVRQTSDGWNHVLSRRILGLRFLNSFGITALNHLPVVQINMPKDVLDGPIGDTATTSYSYNLNASYGPHRDYLADVAALPPFIVIAGTADPLSVADQYAPTMGAVTDKGRYDLLLGASHLGVVDDPRTLGIIKGFLDEF